MEVTLWVVADDARPYGTARRLEANQSRTTCGLGSA